MILQVSRSLVQYRPMAGALRQALNCHKNIAPEISEADAD